MSIDFAYFWILEMFRQYVYLYFTIYQNNLILGMPVPNVTCRGLFVFSEFS